MNTLACVVAKGESARLPGKNLKSFCGLPLVEWSIIQAKHNKWVNIVAVVTDSKEIADIAEKYEAHVEWQTKEEIAEAEKEGAYGGLYAMLRGIKWGEEYYTQRRDALHCFVSLLPTAPLRKINDIDNAIDLWRNNPEKPVYTFFRYKDMVLYEHGRGNVVAPVLFDKGGKYARETGSIGVYMPQIYRDYNLDENGKARNVADIFARKIAQDRNSYVPYWVEPWQELDIDYQGEFEVCEYWMKEKILQGRGPEIYKEYQSRELSEYGFKQNAGQYNKVVESNLLPTEYASSFFNHFSIYLESQRDEMLAGFELVKHSRDGAKETVQFWRANSARDVLANKLTEPKPALIIGSGFSLGEAGKYLKDWKGVSFCSTSQATTLVKYGCIPTYIVAYDIQSHPGEIEQIDTPWESKGTVLITHPGVNPNLHKWWKGNKLLFRSMDSNNFFFANILPLAYQQIIPSQMFLFSCSVAAQISLAKAMGYSPLFLVGCDFAAGRFDRWYYEGEWKCEKGSHSVKNDNRIVMSKNGLQTDALIMFYKRSTLCVWRIDHSQCFIASPSSTITEMPQANLEAVVAYQGEGFEDKGFTNQQIDDAAETYLAHFNQFIVKFVAGGVRVVETPTEGSQWDQSVQGYMVQINNLAIQQGQEPMIDVEANMTRFRWLKEQAALDSN